MAARRGRSEPRIRPGSTSICSCPPTNSDQQWRWEIAFEDGGTDYGTFRRENLVMLGSREH